MIQFFNDRPSHPLEAYVWFEKLFREIHLSKSYPGLSQLDGMRQYMLKLLVVKRDLWSGNRKAKEMMTAITPYWDFYAFTEDDFNQKIRQRFGKEFDEEIFRRFERDVLDHVKKIKQDESNFSD